MVIGPVVGIVTETTAKILFEFNRDLACVLCVLRPIATVVNNKNKKKEVDGIDQDDKGNNQEVSVVMDDLKAYKVASFHFDNLMPSTLYDIFLPDIIEKKHVGSFRTFSTTPVLTQINVTGSIYSEHMSVIDHIVDHIDRQQSIDLRGLKSIVGHWCIVNDCHPLSSPFPPSFSSSSSSSPSPTSSYGRISNMSHQNHANLTIHLGTHSVPTHLFPRIAEALCDYSERLEVPLCDASALGK